jgi:probable rRNA maturation factor
MDPAPSPPTNLVIDIAVPCAAWRERRPDVDAVCRAAVRAAMVRAEPELAAAAGGGAEFSLVLADDATSRELNREWRGRDRPTNVISFPAQDLAPGVTLASVTPPGRVADAVPLPLGDIVLAYETVAAEAAAQGKDFADHLRHLVVHGTLHLLGHDHEIEAEAERMEALETAILAELGVPDPYADRDTAAAAALEETAHG